MQFADLLTPDQVKRVHEASLDILENVGLLVRNDRAKEIFVEHGLTVDAETEIVKFPRPATGAPCDFVDRAALKKHKAGSAKRRLTTLTTDGKYVIYGGEAVFEGASVVGRMRSGGCGYTVGKNIGLANLPLEPAHQGTDLRVDVFGDRVPAQVAPDVLCDSKGDRLRM